MWLDRPGDNRGSRLGIEKGYNDSYIAATLGRCVPLVYSYEPLYVVSVTHEEPSKGWATKPASIMTSMFPPVPRYQLYVLQILGPLPWITYVLGICPR